VRSPAMQSLPEHAIAVATLAMSPDVFTSPTLVVSPSGGLASPNAAIPFSVYSHCIETLAVSVFVELTADVVQNSFVRFETMAKLVGYVAVTVNVSPDAVHGQVPPHVTVRDVFVSPTPSMYVVTTPVMYDDVFLGVVMMTPFLAPSRTALVSSC